jgi:hypothetical protein
MRSMILMCAFVVLAFAAGIAWADAPLHLEIAGGPALLSGTRAQGEGLSVGVTTPLSSWASVGIQGDLYRLDGRASYTVIIPENIQTADDTHAGAGLLITRLEVPHRHGLAPFVAIGAGWAGLRYGTLHFHNMFSGESSGFVRHDTEHALASMLDFGFAGRWSRPIPQVQLEVQMLRLSDSETAIAPRVMLRY